MTIYLLNSDARHIPLADKSVQCVVTSPPYWGLRDYGVAGQIGLERTPQEYVASIVLVMREVWRVLRDDGVLWLNLGDSYAGSWGNYHPNSPAGKHGQRLKATARWNRPAYESQEFLPPTSNKLDGLKPKDLVGIPWRVAFALQDAGWYLRSDIIWSKPNPMPESVTDRPTKAHEYIFLLAKSERYYYDSEAIKEPAKVWEGQAATFERTGPVAFHVLPGQTAAQHRPNRNGKNAFRGQGAHRENETGKAHREGRDVTDTGNGPTRNRRSVWTVATTPYSGAHFATFPPTLVEPMILAGSRPAGKHCDCDEIIWTPTGNGEITDPSLVTGRAGMNRPRRDNEGTRQITRREQRWHAEQMKNSDHIVTMSEMCGPAFAHYIRTDRSGARPLPENLRVEFMRLGFITEAPPCNHGIEPADIVLDPFSGSGTVGRVSAKHGRRFVGLDLNPSYIELAQQRTSKVQIAFQL